MNEIIIVNKHHKKTYERSFYVGRPSPLGNIFVITERWDRNHVCDLYEKWLNKKIQDQDERVLEALDDIASLVLDGTGKPVHLECFCAPARCHADHIKKVIQDAIAKSQ